MFLSGVSAFSSTATIILFLAVIVSGGPQNQRSIEQQAATATRVANVEARVVQIDHKLDLNVLAFDKKLDVILLQLRASGAIGDAPGQDISPPQQDSHESVRPPGLPPASVKAAPIPPLETSVIEQPRD